MSDTIGMWPIVIFEDRYSGTYSGGTWVAVADFNRKNRDELIDDGIHGGDLECAQFWETNRDQAWIAVGTSPNEALDRLTEKWLSARGAE